MNAEPGISSEQARPQDRVASLMGRAFEMRMSGRIADATAQLEQALLEARSTPYEIEFQTRIQLAMTLADVYQSVDETLKASSMLAEEAAFAGKISEIMQLTGTPSQKRAATSGFLQVRDRATQMTLIGQEAPEISVKLWLQGGPASLATFAGRVVLLEFWATWCKPCQEMFPKLKQLHENLGSQGLEVIALTRHYMAYGGSAESMLEEGKLMLDMVTRHEVNFHVGIAEDERLQTLYGANGLPTLVLIDRNRVIQYAGPGEDNTFNIRLERSLQQQ